jgi:glycosyltransferase involved in cell wall biosynthesis
MFLSCVVITFNEENNILRCLSSIKDVADEILIVDSYSTDKTKEIVQQFPNIRFVQNAWQGYSAQKNFANNISKYDNILSIDADEELSQELKQSILKLKKGEINFNDVFIISRKTNYCGNWIKHCGWYPDKKIRLFNKNYALWQGDIHEVLVFKDDNPNIIQLNGDLFHYSCNSTFDHINQLNKFSSIGANEYLKKGKEVNIFSILFKSQWKFIRDYFFKLGILDGWTGFRVCYISAFATFIKYVKLKEEQSKH